MARKKVTEGGKRDEIIAAAAQLFFSQGYENTSVRSILERVDGEVGMFYHYFKSKDELFDVVADRFFRQYEQQFSAMIEGVSTPEEFAEWFLPLYQQAMQNYGMIQNNMHWTIRSALHERTVVSLVPSTEKLLKQFGYSGKYSPDTAAGILTAAMSSLIHCRQFNETNEDEKKKLVVSLIEDIIKA